jgi:hypothetical protein
MMFQPSNDSARGRPRPSIAKLLLLGCCVFSSTHLSRAASSLESHSPFLPHGYSKAQPAPAPKPVAAPINGPLSKELEFRGVIQLQGIYQFSLFSKKDNRGYWIPENSSESGIKVSNFDRDTMRVTVTRNGRIEQLTLQNATDKPLPVVRTKPAAAKVPKPSQIPGLNANDKKKQTSKSRSVPRRRVILPKNTEKKFSVGY